MLKHCTLTVLSLAALGLGAGQASAAGWFSCWKCCHKYTVCCKPYNAFSPPCCYPCGKGWPCYMEPFAMHGCGHGGCGYGHGGCADGSCGPVAGAPMMGEASAPATMPPASAVPNYMPPAPAEVGDAPQGALPLMPVYPQAAPQGMPYGMPMPMMRPVVFQPAYAPAYYPQQPAYYPMPAMPMQQMPPMQRGW
ncbi:MAG: hypothetical protein JNM56_07265 [Planctomycetia bacterium]|nr:hypothetical protein [Planctomycetia bacterium]